MSMMKSKIINWLLKILLYLLREEKSPIVSLAAKLNGHGFVIVPKEQWEGIWEPNTKAKQEKRDKNEDC